MNVWALRLFGAVTGDAEALFLRLLRLARAKYGAELAHDRLRAGGPTPASPPLEQLESTLTRGADVHTFFGFRRAVLENLA
jgi:hypothetical protein